MARDARRRMPREQGLDFLSTPFDHEAVDLLDELGVKAFKVATYELWHLPLIRDIASRGKPIICSTGMADMADVQAAVDVVRETRQRPADPAALRRQLPAAVRRPEPARDRDDAPGIRRAGRLERPHARLAGAGRRDGLGAAVIEKHFTTDRGRPGPDHRFALEPDELAEMVRAIRDTEAALGDRVKRRAPAEDDLYVTARRSLFAARAIEAGAVVSADDIAVLRPGHRPRGRATSTRSSDEPRAAASSATSRSPGTCSDRCRMSCGYGRVPAPARDAAI